jgi:hypothetical protein
MAKAKAFGLRIKVPFGVRTARQALAARDLSYTLRGGSSLARKGSQGRGHAPLVIAGGWHGARGCSHPRGEPSADAVVANS